MAVLVIGVPALAIGGVPPWVVPIVAALALLWWASLRGAGVRWPRGLGWMYLLAAFTAWQALPLPGALGQVLAPPGHLAATEAWGTADGAWGSLSIAPTITAHEATRLVVLASVAWCAAQTPWPVVARAIVYASLAVLAVGLVQLATGAHDIFGIYAPRARPGTSAFLTSFVNPNHQASLFLLGCFSAWALQRNERAQLSRVDSRAIAWTAAAVACAAGVVLSVSRGAVLVLVLAVVVCSAWRGRSQPRDRRIWLLCGAALFVAALLLMLAPRLARRLVPLTQSHGAASKFETAHAALELLAEAPWFGTGRGTAIDLLPLVGLDGIPITTHVEVAPVTMWIEWGVVVGGLASIAVALFLGHLAWRRDDARRPLAVGLCAWALHNLVDFNWEFLGTATAAAAAAGTLAPRDRGDGGRLARWRSPAVGAGLALALLASLLLAPHANPLRGPFDDPNTQRRWRPLDARAHLMLARTAMADAQLEVAARHAAAAERLRKSADAATLRAELHARRKDYEAFARAVRDAWVRTSRSRRSDLARWLAARCDAPLALALILDDPPGPDFYETARAAAPTWAQTLMETRLELEPTDPSALRELTKLYMSTHEFERAAELADRWRTVTPTDAAAHASFAIARARARPDEAATRSQALLAPELVGQVDNPALLTEARARIELRRADPAALQRVRAELIERLPQVDDTAVQRRLRELLRKVEAATRDGTPRPAVDTQHGGTP